MKKLFLIFFLFNILSFETFSKPTIIESDEALEKQLQIYQLFLKGLDQKAVEEEIGHSIPESNHHQALDHLLYLIGTKRRRREDVVCTRTDYLKEEFGDFSKSARKIQRELDFMYLEYTDYSDPSLKSCEFCYADKNCLDKHKSWQEDTSDIENQYSQYQEDYQKEFCGAMAYYAEQSARPPLLLPPSINPSNGLSVTISRSNSSEFNFYYDFSVCQKKQTFCPETEDDNSYLHPSCYAQDDAFSMEEVKEKVSWMDDFSNKILNSCPGFPIPKPKLDTLMRDQKQLFTCFEKEFQLDPNTPNILNLNIDSIIGSNIKEPIRKIEFKDGSTLKVPLTEFHKQRIALSNEYTKQQDAIGTTRSVIDKMISEKYNNQFFPNTKLRIKDVIAGNIDPTDLPEELKDLVSKIQQLTIEQQQTADKLDEILSIEQSELASISPPEGYYKSGLDIMKSQLKYLDRLNKTLPDFPNTLKSEVITKGDRIEEFPSDQNTLKTLNSFLELKISQIISETGKVKNQNKQNIYDVASVWAKECLKDYFKTLNCDKGYPTTPECNKCPKSLTPRDYDTDGKPTAMTKVYHQQQFYKGRKCVDFKKLIKEVEVKPEQRRKACSQDLTLPSKQFLKIRPSSCP